MRRPIIGIMGAGEPTAEPLAVAGKLGRLIAERGWIVLTGGRPVGVMAAACAGAKQIPGSLTLGILPSASGEVGSDVDLAVFTGMGDARNAINVLTSDVIVACGVEGPGTVSEIALALKADKPVILLGAPATARDFFGTLRRSDRLREASVPEEVIQIIECGLGIARGPAWGSR
jgi:uncharacterized protein (TIGR00725 family)